MRVRALAGRPRGLRAPLTRVLVMNAAGGRVADVDLDYGAFPEEGPTVWITPGMISVLMDQQDGEFWAEAARLTSTTGPNGKGWTGGTMPAILRYLRQQAAIVASGVKTRAERPWTLDAIADICEAAGLPRPTADTLPPAGIVAAQLRSLRATRRG